MKALKTAIGTALGLALLASGPVMGATTIQFDPDGVGGTNGTLTVGSFDWNVSSSLALDIIPAQVDDTFQVYTHAALSQLNDGDGNATGDLSGFEITFVAGFGETVTNLTTFVDGDGNPTGSLIVLDYAAGFENFFRVYYDDTPDANQLAGTGFNDGTLILEATVNDLLGTFLADFGGTVNLDQFGDTGDDWAGQQTVSGTGSTALDAIVNTATLDGDYFKSDFTAFLVDLFFNTTNNLPFQQTDPSRCFTKADNSQICEPAGDWSLGDVNGISGPDIIFQTDANQSFQAGAIPEPAPLALLAFGLALIGAQRLRKNRTNRG